MILWTLYSPKISQFEKISKLQLCSVIRAAHRITTKKYVPRTTLGQWPRSQRNVRYRKFLQLIMSFKHFRNLVNLPLLKNPILFHQSFVLLGNVPDYEIKLRGAPCLVIWVSAPDYEMKYGSSCDSTKIFSLFIVLSELVAVDWNLVNSPLLGNSIFFTS